MTELWVGWAKNGRIWRFFAEVRMTAFGVMIEG